MGDRMVGELYVSIPERVWGGLELGLAPGNRADIGFQSLRGFGVGWSGLALRFDGLSAEFQSLRGFGVGWSVTRVLVVTSAVSFQSLRGFGVGWSDKGYGS